MAMKKKTKQVAQGRLVSVQEQRFQLLTDQGQGVILTLAKGAPVSIDDLHQLQRANTRVIVEYEGEPNLASGVAHQVKPAEAAVSTN